MKDLPESETQYWDAESAAKEMDRLQDKCAELERQVVDLTIKRDGAIEQYFMDKKITRQQLVAQQLQIQALRETLEGMMRAYTEIKYKAHLSASGHFEEVRATQQALAQPFDASALDDYVMKILEEACCTGGAGNMLAKMRRMKKGK